MCSTHATSKRTQWAGFFDLSAELRNYIYELHLVVPEHERNEHVQPAWMRMGNAPATGVGQHLLVRRPKIALEINIDNPIRLQQDPPLLRVSRQFRNEADSIYWGKNECMVIIDTKYDGQNNWHFPEKDLHSPMELFAKWVDMVGIHRLKYLRDFTLSLNICYKPWRCPNRDFRVISGADYSLQIDLPTITCPMINIQTIQMARHMAKTRSVTKKDEWRGRGIVYFFLANKNFWATWFFSAKTLRSEGDADLADDWFMDRYSGYGLWRRKARNSRGK